MLDRLRNSLVRLFGTEKFPFRFFVVYLLLVVFYTILEIPLTERLGVLSVDKMELAPDQKEMALNMLTGMRYFTILFAVVGSIVEALLFALLLRFLLKLSSVEFKFNKCVLLFLIASCIMLADMYVCSVMNMSVGIENINSFHETFRTSLAALLSIESCSFGGNVMLVITPLLLVSFAFMWYGLLELTDIKRNNALWTILFLFILYILYKTVFISFEN